MIEENMKLVDYDKYCPFCVHVKEPDEDNVCHFCLQEPARQYSHKPLNFEERSSHGSKN